MDTNRPVKAFLRASELARAGGVSTDTLRHYERKGVLPRPRRSSNGYREYSERALERVRVIRQALAVGFTIEELSAVFRVSDRGGTPCLAVRTLAAEKLAQIEMRIDEMLALRNELRESLKDWDLRLAETPAGEQAGHRGIQCHSLTVKTNRLWVMPLTGFKKAQTSKRLGIRWISFG